MLNKEPVTEIPWLRSTMMWTMALGMTEDGVHYTNAVQQSYREMISASVDVTYVWHLRVPEMSKRIGGLFGSEVGQLRMLEGQNERRDGQKDIEMPDSRDGDEYE